MPYDASDLATDLNWVRFKIGDTGSTAQLADDEITFLLSEEPNKWYAAAAALAALKAEWQAAGKGIYEKRVDELMIRRGIEGVRSVDDLIGDLRAEGARRLAGTSVFPFVQAVGGSATD